MDSVAKIRVGQHLVGIVGLKETFEDMASDFSSKSDDEVREELLGRLKTRNYIPPRAYDDYGRAFVREFRKFLGQPYTEDSTGGLEIKVFGPGCAQCDRLEMEIYAVLNELNLPALVDHVTDLKEIGRSGVFGTPALMINGRVLSVGSVPPRAKIKKWLEEAEK